MGRMKDIYIETEELAQAVLNAADSLAPDESPIPGDAWETLLYTVSNHLVERGWQSPTEVAARQASQREDLIAGMAAALAADQALNEAGDALLTAVFKMAWRVGLSQRELLNAGQDRNEQNEEPSLVDLGEIPEPVPAAA